MHGKAAIASLMAGLVLVLGVMAACPALHELVHGEATQAGHECAVTMLAHGKVDICTVDISVVTPSASIEIVPQIIFSVFAPAIENLPAGRAPPTAASSLV